jgi:hypothetical protein
VRVAKFLSLQVGFRTGLCLKTYYMKTWNTWSIQDDWEDCSEHTYMSHRLLELCMQCFGPTSHQLEMYDQQYPKNVIKTYTWKYIGVKLRIDYNNTHLIQYVDETPIIVSKGKGWEVCGEVERIMSIFKHNYVTIPATVTFDRLKTGEYMLAVRLFPQFNFFLEQ